MFAIGDYVVHGYSGLCLVEDVTSLDMGDIHEETLYYILRPLNSQESKIYLPVDNDKVIGRKIMTAGEANSFLESIDETEEFWIPNHKMREEAYKNAMKTCDGKEWFRIIRTLYGKQTERADLGKRLSTSDERFLKHAEEYLFGELSLALGLSLRQVEDIVRQKISKMEGPSVE